MVLSSNIKGNKAIMAKNYNDYKYFENRPDVVKIFDDLDAYLDFCRIELCDYNPADLYRKESANWQAYMTSKRNKRYGNNRNYKRNNEQHFSR